MAINRSTSDPLNNQQIELLFHEIDILLTYNNNNAQQQHQQQQAPMFGITSQVGNSTIISTSTSSSSSNNNNNRKLLLLSQRLLQRVDHCMEKLDQLSSKIVLSEYYLHRFKSYKEDLESMGMMIVSCDGDGVSITSVN